MVDSMMRAIVVMVGAVLMSAATAYAADGELKFAELGQCRLESGQVIEECRVGYRTFGTLNAAADNAVLMPTWLYGTSADLVGLFGDPAAKPGANVLVDTTRFYGIAVDTLGDGVSSSPSNSKRQHGTAFPKMTMRDVIAVEYRLVTETLGLKHLHAVLGLSMGGEQTFGWAAAHPGFFDLAAPILGTPRLTSYDLEVKRIMVETIESDAGFAGGQYTTEPKLGLANLFGSLVVTSPAWRNGETTREGLEAFVTATEARQAIDANDRMAQLRTIMTQDVVGKGTIVEAAHRATAKFLVIVSAEDHLVNPQPALEWAGALGAETYVSQGTCAHLIMLCDAEAVSKRVRAYLAKK
jgi:homoserine O-acetyltransferase